MELFMKMIFICRDMDRKYTYGFQQLSPYYLLLFGRLLLLVQFKISATLSLGELMTVF